MLKINKTCFSIIYKESKNHPLIRRYAQKVETNIKSHNLNYGSKKEKVTPWGYALLAIPITTFALGCWQVKRKVWKENLIRQLEEKLHSSPINLPDNLDELLDMEYQSVIVRGKFIHEKELYLGPRSFVRPDGGETQGGLFSQQDRTNGYLVITPFKLSGREEVVLINRGWIPRGMINPDKRKGGQISGEVELTGILRKGESRPQFSPDHKGNIYFYRDLGRMCSETNADPILIDADYNSTISDGPIGGQTRVTLRNDHLSYLITWFSLSAATSYMWFHQIVKRKSF